MTWWAISVSLPRTSRSLFHQCNECGFNGILALQPVNIALAAEVLHREKVSFPLPILFAEVNPRIQLLQGFHEGVIVIIRWDDLVGEVRLALLKWRDEILHLLTHEHRHSPFG